jgi:type IV pilus assembly protein PilE
VIARRPVTGFTLLELLIALAILGILGALGYPVYVEQLRKAHRAEGMAELLELADRMERHYADAGTYDVRPGGADMDAATLWKDTTTYGYYSLSIDAGTNRKAFTARATPTARGGQDRDPCGTFVIDALGMRTLDTTNGGRRAATGLGAGDCWR